MITAIPQMPPNSQLACIMHIDLNSCFAIIEQQANRLLRGRPVGVAAYDTPHGFVLAASYEAKACGVKLGVTVEQARALAPGIVIMTPDPAKYREAHKRFKAVLEAYTPKVVAKSIDEFVLDFSGSPTLAGRSLDASQRTEHNQYMRHIGNEIKAKIKQQLGEWVTVNIGTSTNRFLAKYAAGFDKPDGMTLIDATNLTDRYKNMHLVDLPGINVRYRARLRQAAIYTPLDFLSSDLNTLKKRVFKSIHGYHWYIRLRGYESDTVEFDRKSIGHQYALKDKTTDPAELNKLLLKLCEKTGRRMRRNDFYATGIHLYLGFINTVSQHDGPASFENLSNIPSWSHGEKVFHRLYSTADIYAAAKRLLTQADIPARVRIMSVHVYGLCDWDPVQLSLFDSDDATLSDLRPIEAEKRISDAVDSINDRYGEYVVTPALMMEMQGTILDRVAFGQVRDM